MKAGQRRRRSNSGRARALRRLAAVCVVALGMVAPGWVSADDFPGRNSAELQLLGCINALPDIPLLVTGEMQSRPKDGDVERKVQVEMLLDWQARPAQARYTIRDAFGKARDHLSITWHEGRDIEYRYLKGDPLESAPLPLLSEPIEGTDISWMDLSLAFLWWPQAREVGRDEVRGRDCMVIDVPAPGADYAGCAGVRLWIDPKIPVMLRAVAYGLDSEPTRRVEVKAFKKINDRWVIQIIEVESLPSGHKTVLRVRDVQDRSRKTFIKVDEGGPEEAAPAGDAAGETDESVAPVTPVPVDEGGTIKAD